MKRLLGVLLTLALVFAMTGGSSAQSVSVDMSFEANTTVQYFSGDKENYVDWGSNQIVVYGYGYVPSNFLNATPAIQRNKAMRMAELNAQQKLLEKCKGVNVASESVVNDAELHEYFTSHSEGFIDGVAYEDYKDNGANNPGEYEVRVKAIALLYGKDSSYAAAVLPYVASKQEPLASTSIYTSASFAANITVTTDNKVQPYVPTGTPYEPPPTVTTAGPYTGLIVDASGLGVRPAMSPNILDPQGKNVYGFIKIDAETVIDYGIVGYARTMDQARKNARAGTNPIIVKGIQKSGNFEADVVISTAEAQKVIDSTQAYDFLGKLKVVILY
jgi:hypothetical protein